MADMDPMAEIRASFFIECEELVEALHEALTALEGVPTRKPSTSASAPCIPSRGALAPSAWKNWCVSRIATRP